MTRALVDLDDDVAWLRLDGIRRRNVLDEEWWDSFAGALDVLEAARTRAIVVTGLGEAFCAGGDLGRMRESFAAMDAGRFEEPERARMDGIAHSLLRWAAMPVPRVAAVNGAAIGAGLALAVSCDYLVAVEEAFFDTGFSRLGLPGDMGVTFYLPRSLGPRKAMLWLLRARRVDAAEALRSGLADEVVASAELIARARSVASALASGASGAVASVVNRTAEIAALGAALDYEREATVSAKQTPFHREAVERFFARAESS